MDLQTRKRMLSSIAVALRTKMNTPKQARDVYAVLASISQGEAKSEILFQMGDCDYAAGEWATGVADCRELYQTDPKGKFAARSKVLEASHLMQSGDYGGARKAFQEILADFPGSPDADVARLYIPMLSLSKQGGERQ
jgi:outer membrane protein assembly factor BamD (BamD/ComL family)